MTRRPTRALLAAILASAAIGGGGFMVVHPRP
jgi:hypothetical protein